MKSLATSSTDGRNIICCLLPLRYNTDISDASPLCSTVVTEVSQIGNDNMAFCATYGLISWALHTKLDIPELLWLSLQSVL
jgi:hypothetical protein